MHSFLITGGNENLRREKAETMAKKFLSFATTHPDLLVVSKEEKNSIGIERVREIIDWIKLKPFSAPNKVILILAANELTLEAQNALLKTLEEPPRNSFLILTAEKRSQLLATVSSRCALVELPIEVETSEKKQVVGHKRLEEILSMGVGERWDFCEENKETISEREEVVSLVDRWLSEIHAVIMLDPGSGVRPQGWIRDPDQRSETKDLPRDQEIRMTKTAPRLLQLKKDLVTTNANPRNLLESFLLDA